MEAVVGGLLRVVGLLYVVGGVAVVRQARVQEALGPDMDRFLSMLEGTPAPTPDPGRTRWLLAGGVLTSFAGAALLVVPQHAVWAVSVLCLHQFAYLARQWRRAKRAASEVDRDEAAPSPSTVNAAMFALAVWVVSAWAWSVS